MDAPAEPTPAGSRVALVVLLALVVLSPWPFGSVHLRTTQAIALISLVHGPRRLRSGTAGTTASSCPRVASSGRCWACGHSPSFSSSLSRRRSTTGSRPGSAFVWHPSEPAAAAVLGPGPHPISIYPEATRRWLAFATGVVGPGPRRRSRAARPADAAPRRTVVMVARRSWPWPSTGSSAGSSSANKLYGVFDVPTVSPFGPFVSKNHFAGYVEIAALLAVGLAVGLADEARRRSGWLSWIDSPGGPASRGGLGRGRRPASRGARLALARRRPEPRGRTRRVRAAASRPPSGSRALSASRRGGRRRLSAWLLVAFVVVLPEHRAGSSPHA